jgi:hypothetical protein
MRIQRHFARLIVIIHNRTLLSSDTFSDTPSPSVRSVSDADRKTSKNPHTGGTVFLWWIISRPPLSVHPVIEMLGPFRFFQTIFAFDSTG